MIFTHSAYVSNVKYCAPFRKPNEMPVNIIGRHFLAGKPLTDEGIDSLEGFHASLPTQPNPPPQKKKKKKKKNWLPAQVAVKTTTRAVGVTFSCFCMLFANPRNLLIIYFTFIYFHHNRANVRVKS